MSMYPFSHLPILFYIVISDPLSLKKIERERADESYPPYIEHQFLSIDRKIFVK